MIFSLLSDDTRTQYERRNDNYLIFSCNVMNIVPKRNTRRSLSGKVELFAWKHGDGHVANDVQYDITYDVRRPPALLHELRSLTPSFNIIEHPWERMLFVGTHVWCSRGRRRSSFLPHRTCTIEHGSISKPTRICLLKSIVLSEYTIKK